MIGIAIWLAASWPSGANCRFVITTTVSGQVSGVHNPERRNDRAQRASGPASVSSLRVLADEDGVSRQTILNDRL
jgi:hypothetical protein